MSAETPPSTFPHNLPNLTPIRSILPLGDIDAAMAQRIEEVQLPPEDLQELALVYFAGIRQSVCLGTHFLDWIYQHPPAPFVLISPIMVYRHMLDIGDSIATLLRLESGQAAFILTRALFECSIALDFLLQDGKQHMDRATAYWTAYRIEQLKTHTKFDPSTDKGKALHDLIDSDEVLKGERFPRRDLSKERDSLVKYLEREPYKPYWDKHLDAKKKRQPLEWYCLCSQAQNLRELARLVNREAEYEIMYGYLSGLAHGHDVFSGIVGIEPDKFSVHQLRGPELKMNESASLASNYLLLAHNAIRSAFLKEKTTKLFYEWYGQFRTFNLWVTTPKGSPSVLRQASKGTT